MNKMTTTTSPIAMGQLFVPLILLILLDPFGLMFSTTIIAVLAKQTSNPICYLCDNDPSATLANPNALVDVTFLNFEQITEVTCEQLYDSGTAGLLTVDQCAQAQIETDFFNSCGCTRSANTTTETEFPPCYVCEGNPDAIMQNPNTIIDATFLNVPEITSATCQQIYDAGLSGFLTPDICDITKSNADVQEQCGCYVAEGTTDVPTDSITGTVVPTDDTTILNTQTQSLSTVITGGTTVAPTDSIPGTVVPTDDKTIINTQTQTLASVLTNPPTDATTSASSILQDTNNTNTTVVDILGNQTDLAVFYNAIETADLLDFFSNETVLFTFFAPIDDAFSSLNPILNELLITPGYILHLQNLILYHAANALLDLNDFPVGDTVETMLNYENVTFTKTSENSGSIIASYPGQDTESLISVDVIETDLASNGLVHKLNDILLPRFVFTNISNIISNDFNILSELVTLGFPSGFPPGNYTIFAPTNDAFLALGDEALNQLKDPINLEVLRSLLGYHIVAGTYPTVLMETGQTLNSLQGLVLNIVESPTEILVNDAAIVTANFLALDGIVHAIDSVLLDTQIVSGEPSSSGTINPMVTTTPSTLGNITIKPTLSFNPLRTISPTDFSTNESKVPTLTKAPTSSTTFPIKSPTVSPVSSKVTSPKRPLESSRPRSRPSHNARSRPKNTDRRPTASSRPERRPSSNASRRPDNNEKSDEENDNENSRQVMNGRSKSSQSAMNNHKSTSNRNGGGKHRRKSPSSSVSAKRRKQKLKRRHRRSFKHTPDGRMVDDSKKSSKNSRNSSSKTNGSLLRNGNGRMKSR